MGLSFEIRSIIRNNDPDLTEIHRMLSSDRRKEDRDSEQS